MDDPRALRDVVRGSVLLPGDQGFEQASLAWNLAVPQLPAGVVTVADASDVASLVGAASGLGVVLAAQPGGHGATEELNGTVLVRTGLLNDIAVDVGAASARVGAGVKWGQVLGALASTGLIGLAGSNPDVSTAGYLLGGGMSWFGRRYGIAASHLRAVEIVDGSGAPRRIDDASDPELMWALRGGGGQFGIITALEVDLPREPQVHGGQLIFPMAAAADVLRAFREVTASADDGLTIWLNLMHVPDLPVMPEEVRGQSLAFVMLTWLGADDAAQESLARLRAAGPVLMDSIRAVPIETLGTVADEPTDPVPFIDWGTTVSDLDQSTCDRLLGTFTDREATALMALEIRHLGGAFRAPDPARPGACDHLDGEYSVAGLAIPMAPEMIDPIHASLADVATAVSDVDLDRVAPTFLSPDSSPSRAFDEQTLGRLRDVKRRVDPNRVFQANYSL